MDREYGCSGLTDDSVEDFMRDLSSGLILGEGVWVVQGIICFFVSMKVLSETSWFWSDRPIVDSSVILA